MLGDSKDARRNSATFSGDVVVVLAWGCLAECVTALSVPLYVVGGVDVSATLLNVLGAFFAGVACALDEAFADARLRRFCASFLAGFISVFTSFVFVVEQSAQLAASPSCGAACGAAYVLAAMGAGCAAFAAGGAAGRVYAAPRASRPPAPPAPPQLARALAAGVAAMCAWALLVAPVNAVADPLAIGVPIEPSASKWTDVAQLGSALVAQAAGLALSWRVDPGHSGAVGGGLVQWGALRANGLACALVLVLHAAHPRLAGAPGSASALLLLRLRSSGCGALSQMGALAQAHVTLWRPRRRRVAAALNFLLHSYLACVAALLLPLLSAPTAGVGAANGTVDADLAEATALVTLVAAAGELEQAERAAETASWAVT